MLNLKIEGPQGLMLMVSADDQVQVPLAPSERILCRQALLDALTLLEQTQIRRSIPSTAGVTGQFLQRNRPHLAYSRAICDLTGR